MIAIEKPLYYMGLVNHYTAGFIKNWLAKQLLSFGKTRTFAIMIAALTAITARSSLILQLVEEGGFW